MSTPYEQMKSGEIYWPSDTSLMEQQFDCLEKLYDFNATRPHEQEKRQVLLKEMLAEVGKDCYIEPPLRANWGGHHLHLGNRVYANFNLTIVDDCDIYIGDHTMIGPNVTIGDNTVIGAGSVVTRDIPAGVLAFGVPCRVQRELGEQDGEYYYRGKRVPQELLKYRKPGKETEA